MQFRVHNLAKELGIPAKTIIELCWANGIPRERILNHMSVVSPDLAQRILELLEQNRGGGGPAEEPGVR